MRTALPAALLIAAAIGGLSLASSAAAQSYGGQRYGGYDSYAPPPPPPPPAGAVFPRDDRYVEGPYTPNSDGTAGYGPYASQPDTTPDDPGRLAYDYERDRRVDEARAYGGYGFDDGPRYRPAYDDDEDGPRYSRGQRDWDGRGYAPPPAGRYGYGYSPQQPSYQDDGYYAPRRY